MSILVDLVGLRDLRALLVALAAEQRDVHHRGRRGLVGAGQDVVAAVAVVAERSHLVAAGRRLPVQATLLLADLATVTVGAPRLCLRNRGDVVLAVAVVAARGPLLVGCPQSTMLPASDLGDGAVVTHAAIDRLRQDVFLVKAVADEICMAIDAGHVAVHRRAVGRFVDENRDLLAIAGPGQLGVGMASEAVLGFLGRSRDREGKQWESQRQEESAAHESGAGRTTHEGSPARCCDSFGPGRCFAMTSASRRLPPWVPSAPRSMAPGRELCHNRKGRSGPPKGQSSCHPMR